MSELLSICEALVERSHGQKPKGLSTLTASRLRAAMERAASGDGRDFAELAPQCLREIAAYWERRFWEGRIADLEHELSAHRLALSYSPAEIAHEVQRLGADSLANSTQHLDGLDRMGSGSRPTASAVAGEAASSGWSDRRRWERAAELHFTEPDQTTTTKGGEQ